MNTDPNISASSNEIDFTRLYRYWMASLPASIGLGLLCAAIGAIVAWISVLAAPTETSCRVVFSFPGFERGLYPDDSKFQPDDLRAPELARQALQNLNIANSEELQSKIRAGLSVVGIISPNISKERERLRALGQVPPAFVPDEYQISLNLPRGFPLSEKQRQLFLNELISLYQTRFHRIYSDLPAHFGTSFSSLRNNDYFEYEFILNQELQNLTDYLSKQLTKAKNFRSVSTGFSFNDLITQTQTFAQIRVNEVMGMIYSTGLTNNRALALSKMDYHLGLLNDEERRLVEQERVVKELLKDAQSRGQNYVLSSKVETRSPQPIVDQTLMDSLIANDAYSFLVKKALEAGLEVQQVRSRREQLTERRKLIDQFVPNANEEHSETKKLLVKAMKDLEDDYNRLVENVKKTQRDYVQQQFADACRITQNPTEATLQWGLLKAAVAGLLIGFFGGCGLSLIRFATDRSRTPQPSSA